MTAIFANKNFASSYIVFIDKQCLWHQLVFSAASSNLFLVVVLGTKYCRTAAQSTTVRPNISTAGGPLSSTKINRRGDVSMNMNGNGALVVVDGVPLSSQMNNSGGSYGAGSNSEGSVDYGNG